MSVSSYLITIAEALTGAFIIWGFWNESRLIKFEEKLLARFGYHRSHARKAKITSFKSKGAQNTKGCV